MKKSLCFLTAFAALSAPAQSVNVADFGAIPNDGKCDMEAIAKALDHVKATGAKELVFEAGVYDLDVGDAQKNRGIFFKGIPNFTMRGAVNEKGEPVTTLLRRYDFKINLNGTNLFRAELCPNFTLKNIVFDNYPQYMANGEVVENDGESIIIKVPADLPYMDGTRAYCANLWDKDKNLVRGKGSVTFGGKGNSGVDDNAEEHTLNFYGDPKDRLLKLTNPKIAKQAAVGEIFSWNFGWLGYQTYFHYCDNLRVENVWTHSAMGFCMQAAHCRNVAAKDVKFMIKPGSSQVHVGSRDAWKLMACKGNAVVENMYCEGVRWDGQNVHGIFAWPFDILDKKTALFSNDLYGVGVDCFPKGSKVGFCDGREGEVLLTVASVKNSEKKTDNGKRMVEVSFAEDLPEFTNPATTCNLYGMNLDSYWLKDSTFRNIAGTASLIRNDDVKITGCTFDNIMYPAICIGGAMGEVEGVVCKNALVENNTFINCTWQPRHGGMGALSVKLQSTARVPRDQNPFIKNMNLLNNKFVGCGVGIQADGVYGLTIKGNTFTDCGVDIKEDDNVNVKIEKNLVKTSK